MASYSITNVTETSVTLQIVPDSAYQYYRVFVRLASDSSDETFDSLYTITSTTYITVSGLEPGTDYVVNVGYNDTGVTHVAGWLGADSFTTEAETEEPTTGDGVVKIYANGAWVNAIPYIYSNGWKQATPYVYSGGWQATKEG